MIVRQWSELKELETSTETEGGREGGGGGRGEGEESRLVELISFYKAHQVLPQICEYRASCILIHYSWIGYIEECSKEREDSN